MMKILLAVDTSTASRAVIEEAAARPWPADSSFQVMSVIQPTHLWTTLDAAQESARRAEEMVRSGVAQLEAKGLPATGITPAGDPKTVILDQAKAAGADFILVGPHGASALRRLLMENVAVTVLRYAECSVEVVRPRKLRKGREGMRVLLATDGSDFSREAALSLAGRPWPAGTEFRILSAVELLLPAARAFLEPPFLDTTYLEANRAEAMQRAQNAIATAAAVLQEAGWNASESVSVLLETPQVAILREAEEWGPDLIVVGSHGHRGFDRFLLGSTSEAVAMNADCSVDVIRKRG
jgi:nucleotide-binding universal stress UspA family protein